MRYTISPKHIFLTGPKRIGKSTAVQKILTLIDTDGSLSLGGFRTYWDGDEGRKLYIAAAADRSAQTLLADRSGDNMVLYPEAFDEQGVSLLADTRGKGLILMDELGFLEEESPRFRHAVLAALDGDIPVLGVLREGNVPWHEPVKAHPRVAVYEVSLDNRDQLPSEIARILKPAISY